MTYLWGETVYFIALLGNIDGWIHFQFIKLSYPQRPMNCRIVTERKYDRQQHSTCNAIDIGASFQSCGSTGFGSLSARAGAELLLTFSRVISINPTRKILSE